LDFFPDSFLPGQFSLHLGHSPAVKTGTNRYFWRSPIYVHQFCAR